MNNKKFRITILLFIFVVSIFFDYSLLPNFLSYENVSFILVGLVSLIPFFMNFRLLSKMKRYLLICEFLLCIMTLYIFIFIYKYNEFVNLDYFVIAYFGFMLTAVLIESTNDFMLIFIPIVIILIIVAGVVLVSSFKYPNLFKICFSLLLFYYYYMFVFRFSYAHYLNEKKNIMIKGEKK